MKLTYLNQWLNDREINAICWTLIHSLWIGLIVAIVAGIVIACTGKSSANLRYRLFCGLLVVFIITISAVGMYELDDTDAIPTKNNSFILPSDQILSENQAVNLLPSSFRDTSLALLNQNAGWLFGVWLIFFVFKSMKLLTGLFYIQRIRSYKVQSLEEEWALKVQEFSERMGVRKQVAVIQSALVKVPVTLGYFKPLIVLPVGLLFQLPAAQVETIIWHELAHIYRRDYLINILQKMIEAIFFFNPAMLWLSAIIREEREACCDDIVLANVHQKTNYLAALVAFHSPKNSAAGLAMGLSLRPNQLMNRLKRMVSKENKRLSGVELVVLVAGFLMLSAFTFIPQVKPVVKNGAVYLKKVVSETLTTAAPEMAQIHKPVAKPRVSSGSVTPVQSDMVKVDTLLKFKSIRFKNSNEDKNNRDLNFIDGQDKRYHLIVANGQLTSVEFNEQVVAPSDFKNYEPVLSQIDNLIAEKLKHPFPKGDIEAKFSKKQSLTSQKGDLPANKKSFSDSLKKQSIKAKNVPVTDASADKARVLGVIASLVQYKIVSNGALIEWFALTEDQLVVNGQKQDSRLHQQLKAKYGIRPDDGLFFGPSRVHGTGIYFDKGDL